MSVMTLTIEAVLLLGGGGGLILRPLGLGGTKFVCIIDRISAAYNIHKSTEEVRPLLPFPKCVMVVQGGNSL